MSTKETEIQAHLDTLTVAWQVYEATYNDPLRQLEHLDATWRCNRTLEALHDAGMSMRRDFDWSTTQKRFVILDKRTAI